MPTLLVIDDEANIQFSIQQLFAGQSLQVLPATTAEAGLRLVAESAPDVILLDIRLGQECGLKVFEAIRRIDAKALVIFITGFSTTETAIEAMKLGAYDYLVKPLDAAQLQQVVSQACEIRRLMRVPAVVDEAELPEDKPDRLIGSGAAMQAVCKQIGRVAPQNVSVLILGESGTGKELLARAIYHHSARNATPFLAINCAAIPEPLLESELFGHEKGAFTGAERQRIGKFEQAHRGTLFLDEVGDMSPHTQAKILRLLQEGKFERVGGNVSVQTDVRILAATNQNLEKLIEHGRFRKDLFYRLRGVTIHVPPLRERRDDIAELAHYFLFRFNRQLGTAVQTIAPEALALMQDYDWPGNVRELQNVVREALIVSAGPTILPEFLPAQLNRENAVEADNGESSVPAAQMQWHDLAEYVETAIRNDQTGVYRRAREHFDRLLIVEALQHSHGNRNQAAAMLGLSRVTLRAKLRSMNLFVGWGLAPTR